MPQKVKAIVLPDGTVRLAEPIHIGEARQAVLHLSDTAVDGGGAESEWLKKAAASVEDSLSGDDFSGWPGYQEALAKAKAKRLASEHA